MLISMAEPWTALRPDFSCSMSKPALTFAPAMLTPKCDLAHCTPRRSEVRSGEYRWLHSSNKCPCCALWKSGFYLGNMRSGENSASDRHRRMLEYGRTFRYCY